MILFVENKEFSRSPSAPKARLAHPPTVCYVRNLAVAFNYHLQPTAKL